MGWQTSPWWLLTCPARRLTHFLLGYLEKTFAFFLPSLTDQWTATCLRATWKCPAPHLARIQILLRSWQQNLKSAQLSKQLDVKAYFVWCKKTHFSGEILNNLWQQHTIFTSVDFSPFLLEISCHLWDIIARSSSLSWARHEEVVFLVCQSEIRIVFWLTWLQRTVISIWEGLLLVNVHRYQCQCDFLTAMTGFCRKRSFVWPTVIISSENKRWILIAGCS